MRTRRRLVAAVVDLPQPPEAAAAAAAASSSGHDRSDVTGLALARTRFRLGSALPSVAAVRTGTSIRFTISEAATARLRFRRAAPGRLVGGRCGRPTRLNRSRRRCTRMLAVRGSVSLPVQAGARRIKFAGRLSARRRLRPGRYQLILRATDAAGNVSTPDRARFRLSAAQAPLDLRNRILRRRSRVGGRRGAGWDPRDRDRVPDSGRVPGWACPPASPGGIAGSG